MEASFLLFIQEHLRTPTLNAVVIFLSWLGDAGWIWIAAAAVFLVFRKTRMTGIATLLALLLGLLLNNLLIKNLVCRPRPYDVIPGLTALIGPLRDWSFPSGHTCSGFAASTVIILGLGRKWAWCYLLASLIALSRLYVGVHYPSDVLAGAVLGALCAFAAYAILTFIRRKRDDRAVKDL